MKKFKSKRVRLLEPVKAAAGNVLAQVGEIGRTVALGDQGELMVEFDHPVGGWPGEVNRRWLSPRAFEVL